MLASPLLCNPARGDARIAELEMKLFHFYASTNDYTAFHAPAVHHREWAAMTPIVDDLLRHQERISMLELGAGRSGFCETLRPFRPRIDYHVQDVTAANVEYLDQVADRVFTRPIQELTGTYDLIFSTFVFEHVATPVSFLENVNRLLRPHGWHVVFCPRYDNPAYICPSLRLLPLFGRYSAALQLAWAQTLSAIDGKPRFFINTDPAVLHGPWFRDADAINVVTRRSLELWHSQNGFRSKRLRPQATTIGERLHVSVMLLANAFQKV